MTSTFSLRGRLGLDASDWVKGAKQASNAVSDVGDQLEKVEKSAGEAGERGGESFGSGMKGAIAAAGIGAAIGTAISLGLEASFADDRGRNVLIRQFGQTAEDAERYGNIAGDLYADAWGDSMEEVAGAVGMVEQRLVETGRISEAQLEGITEKALAVADTFGTDVNDVIRSTSQLMLNNLAPDADTAFDILVTGLQDGANAAGDLFDSVDEYAQHFDAFGLSAEDMMVMFTTGMQNGQRDTDKLADAVKEFRIRAVEDTDAINGTYAALGVSADEYREKILAGGDSAREVFVDIINRLRAVQDPTDRNRLAVELLGTQYEDLGPTALDTLAAIETKTLDVAGASDQLVSSYRDTETGLETLKRKGVDALRGVGEVAGEMIRDLGGMEDPLDRMQAAWGELERVAPASMEAARAAVVPYVASTEEAEEAVRLWVAAQDDLTQALLASDSPAQGLIEAEIAAGIEAREAADAQAELAEQLGDTSAELEDQTDTFEDMSDEVSDLIDEINDLYDAQNDLVDSAMSAERAQLGLEKATQSFADVVASGATPDSIEYREALLSAKDAAFDVAAANAEAAIATRLANGETLTAAQRQDIYRQSLQNVANTTSGPVRAALDDHLARLARVPANKITKIAAEMDVSRAEATLAYWLNLPRKMKIDSYVTTPKIGDRYRAKGGPVAANDWYVVGEQGPEIFVPNTSGMIIPNGPSMQMMSAPNVSVGGANVSVMMDGEYVRAVVRESIDDRFAQMGMMR